MKIDEVANGRSLDGILTEMAEVSNGHNLNSSLLKE
jgi:hypothetical protein